MEAVDEYKRYSAMFLRQRLKEKIYAREKVTAGCSQVFASVLFADISGFTRLSSRLSAEELKSHINEYFTKLLDVVHENSGDVVKFCGDAVMIMWAVPMDASEDTKAAAVLMSAVCALQLIEECGNYRKPIRGTVHGRPISTSLGQEKGASLGSSGAGAADGRKAASQGTAGPPSSPSPNSGDCTPGKDPSEVQLSLHCGIACGTVHCMLLGTQQRMEFLLSGPVLREMGAAETCAEAGQVCVHRSAYARIQDKLDALAVTVEETSQPQRQGSGPVVIMGASPEAVAGPAAPSPDSIAGQVEEAVRDVEEVNRSIAAALDDPRHAAPLDPAIVGAGSAMLLVEGPGAEVYRLTGGLSQTLLASRARRRRTAATSPQQQSQQQRQQYTGESSETMNGVQEGTTGERAGDDDSTASYIENLARRVVSAGQGQAQHPHQLRRARVKITATDVVTAQAVLAGMSEEPSEVEEDDHFPAAESASGTHTSVTVSRKGPGFLSRIRSSKLFGGNLSGSLCSDAGGVDPSLTSANGASQKTSSPATAGRPQLGLTIPVQKSSFFLPVYSSFRYPPSPAVGRRARQPLQSRMSAALSQTRSSLSLFPVSWPSLRSIPSGNLTASEETETVGGGQGWGGSVSLYRTVGPTLEGMEECDGEDTTHQLGSSSTDRQGEASPGCEGEAAPGSPSRPVPALLQLPVAVVKRRLRYDTASVFATVRAYQDDWDHGQHAKSGKDFDALLDLRNDGFVGLGTGTDHLDAYCGGAKSRRASQTAPRRASMTGTKRTRLATELRKFMHESAVRAIESNTVAFLSELRDVAVVFTQVLDLEQEFELGQQARPQRVFAAILTALRQCGGSLRQFVVDDKGCVAIGCFGLSGSSHQNNCVQAVEYAMCLRTLLHTLGCRSASGITFGRLYCGLVGAGSRCEYAVMGSSVNLAARLMAAVVRNVLQGTGEAPPGSGTRGHQLRCNSAVTNSVLVDASVHTMTSQAFQYHSLPHIIAKGYTLPVAVFAAVRKISVTPSPHPPAGSQPTLQLAEREGYVQRIVDVLRPCPPARPQVFRAADSPPLPFVLVTGTKGLGRSALLRHAASSLGDQSRSVAVVQVDPVNQYLAYDLVRELLIQVMGLHLVSPDRTAMEGRNAATPVAAPPVTETEVSCRLSFATAATAVHGALHLRSKLRRHSSSKRLVSHSLPGAQRRSTLASTSLRVAGTTTLRRHFTAGGSRSNVGDRRPLTQTDCAVVDEDGLCTSALSPHTIRFMPARHSAGTEHATAAGVTVGAASLVATSEGSNSMAKWCTRYLSPLLTIADAFSLCYPSADLTEVLLSQQQSSVDESAVKTIAAAPVADLLFLLNPVVGEGVVTVSSASLCRMIEDSVSPAMQDLLIEMLLRTILLAAIGVTGLSNTTRHSNEDSAWILCVDDLHLADAESQILLCNVIHTAHHLVASGGSVRGGVLLTAEEGASAGAAPTGDTITSLPMLGHTATSPKARARPSWATRRSSVMLTQSNDPAELLTHFSLGTDGVGVHGSVLPFLRLHCEVLTLNRLSPPAVRDVMQQVLGMRNWVWLLSNAQQALGEEVGVRKGSGLVGAGARPGQVRRRSMLVGPTAAFVGESAWQPRSCKEPACRRNGVSASHSTCEAARLRLLGGRTSSDARLSTADASLLRTTSGLTSDRCAAVAAAAAHPELFQRHCSPAEYDALVTLVYTLSQNGIPAVLMELCTSLRDCIASGEFRFILELPAVVRRNKLILEVLDELGGVEVAVLKAAAVVGAQFDTQTLAATLEGMDLAQCAGQAVLSATLDRLVGCGLLQWCSSATSTQSHSACTATFSSAGGAETEGQEYRFAEAATQLAIYNLMLQTQRTVAHSVIAAYLENKHRRLLRAEQLRLITHHYLLSDNAKKQIEYLQRSAAHLAREGDCSGAVEHYAELVHLALGCTIAELVEQCRTREVAAIQAVTALQQPSSPAPVMVTSPPHDFSAGAKPCCSESTKPSVTHRPSGAQFRVFHNKVASAEEEQAKVRRLTQMELNTTVAATLVVPRAEAARTVVVRPDPFLGKRQAEARQEREELCALSLRDLLLMRKLLARWLCLHPEVDTSTLHCWGTEVCPVQVVPSAVMHGVTVVAVSEWLGAAAEIMRETGRGDEAIELAAVAVHLWDSRATDGIAGAGSYQPTHPTSAGSADLKHVRARRRRTSSAVSDDAGAGGDGRNECLDAATRCALEFLDAETAQHRLSRDQDTGEGMTPVKSRRWYSGLRRLSQLVRRPSRPVDETAHSIPRIATTSIVGMGTTKAQRFLAGTVRGAVDGIVASRVPPLRTTTAPPTCDAPLSADLRGLLSSGTSRPHVGQVHHIQQLEWLASDATERGEAGSAVVLLEEALQYVVKDSSCAEQQARCWGQLSLALRFSGCGAPHTLRCLELALDNDCSEALTAGQQWLLCAQHLALSGELRSALQCLAVAEGAVLNAGPDAVIEVLSLKGWMLVLSGDVTSASVVLSTMKDALSTDFPPSVLVIRQIQQLELLVLLAEGVGRGIGEEAYEGAAAEVMHGIARDDQEHGLLDRVLSGLCAYVRMLRQRRLGQEGVPLTSSQLAGLLSGVMGRLCTDGDAGKGPGQGGGVTSLPSAVVLCLNLYSGMRDLRSVLDELSASGSTDANTHSELLTAVTAVATAMAQLDTVSNTCAAVRPLFAILTAQYELLFYHIYDYFGPEGPSIGSCDAGAGTAALVGLIKDVFAPASFVTAAPSSVERRRLKPSGTEFATLRPEPLGRRRWWKQVKRLLSGRTHTGRVRDAPLTALEYAAHSRDSDVQAGYPLPSALREYSMGLTVAKLQRLRSYVQSQVTACGATAADGEGDPYTAIVGACQRHLHQHCARQRARQEVMRWGSGSCGGTDDSGSNSEGEERVDEHDRSCSTVDSRDSRTDSEGEGGAGGDLVHSQRAPTVRNMRQGGATAVVHVSSMTNTGGSAAEICLEAAVKSKATTAALVISEAQWELFPFARPVYEDVMQEIGAAEEGCREELSRYVTQLMDRMRM